MFGAIDFTSNPVKEFSDIDFPGRNGILSSSVCSTKWRSSLQANGPLLLNWRMIVPVQPPLEGLAAERFLALAQQLARCQDRRLHAEFAELLDAEVRWARTQPHLNGCRETYEAASRVLIDLARLTWTIHPEAYSIELRSPTFRPDRQSSPDDIGRHKRAVREELAPLREAQFREESVRRFIRRMEKPIAHSKQKSILHLIADGRELHARLGPALETTGAKRVRALAKVVQPYLQLVPDQNETEVKDEFTGIPLGDIWRYFRFTWVLPQLTIPGRQILYLVRDAAHPCHAVMGIAALSNSAMQMRDRDDHIGWTFDSFAERARTAAQAPDAKPQLDRLFARLEANVAGALENLEPVGIVTAQEIQNPTPELVARLRRRSEEFARLREDALRELLAGDQQPYVLQETETPQYAPPVSDEVLKLEGKVMSKRAIVAGRRMLVAKKRAFEFSRLLQARHQLRIGREAFLNPTTTLATLRQEDFQIGVGAALFANKSARAGVNMLELTTCGAIKPYNQILAGKLTALLMLSPQVAADYRRRYGESPSIISSQLKNAPVRRDNTLVYLGTTSLYALGSSQYERLRLPAGIIAPDQAELRYQHIGYTSGFGTVQFAPDTTRSVERVLERKLGFQNINSIFGEGPSPRLRKLRAGLEELGYDPESLMRHNQHRLIYAAPLCAQALDYLRGESASLPDYVANPEKHRDATGSIASFWRERWLASRLNHKPTIQTLALTHSWALSAEVPVEIAETPEIEAAPTGQLTAEVTANADVEFWRSLAGAGTNVCSDELTTADLNRLHVIRPLEDFLKQRAAEGYSIVLTGNAGDGKTHLLKQIEPDLRQLGAVIQPDATAIPRGDIALVINQWRQALAAGKPYCLAANEYPLYELRTRGRDDLPILAEVDRQCRQRLAYSPQPDATEEALSKVIVVDLSLRNPLGPDFLGSLLDRLLKNPSLVQLARSGTDPNFTRNFNRLAHPVVRERLLGLFHRIVLRGQRAPVRELWIIVTRLLFGSRPRETLDALSPRAWYSERLFEPDDRFGLSQLLRRHCDPTRCSHPQWDAVLERGGTTNPADWRVDGQEPLFSLHNDVGARFDAMKRAFYFEHACGEDAFALEEDAAKQFQQLLTAAEHPDETFKKELIERINLCYCPRSFSGMKDALYLWIGHRFHEKPTRSYVANQSIASGQFQVQLPRLPRRLTGALDFVPDHFLLRYEHSSKTVSLRVDYSLFNTLAKLGNGMPRHLVPERDVNRLDVFLEQLQALGVQQERVFIAFNAEHRLVSRIRLSIDWKKYEEVSAHE
jgi:hypothetical protein